jgi:eukaryotic-like serine/threonine-protein kinase
MISPPGIASSLPARALAAAVAPSRAADCRLRAWQLTQVIHRGRWMTLFRARPHNAIDGPGCYVVKAATAQGAEKEVARAMLAREETVGAAVSHPNLVANLATHVRRESAYVVRPYLEGLTLRQWLALERAPMAIASALWIIRQMAEALSAMHGAGWLHGQVRPEHVLVSPQGHATLIDLALARRLGTDECAAGLGRLESLAYVSPESLSANARVCAASDTYCLGLLLYESLAGRLPFGSTDPDRLTELHRRHTAPDIRAYRPEAPPELWQLLRLMLAKEPLRRPSDEELVRWLTELEIAALGL